MNRAFVFVFGLSLVSCQYWKQVWSDEFDGTSIDMSKWQFEVNCDGGGNNELQCYTSKSTNARVQNGKLVITARPENLNGKAYTSARLNTAKSASWLFGRFEMNAKLPSGKHLWPAFWMLPTDYKYGTWAASGEIDIMEYRGQVTNSVEGTLHFGGAWPNNMYQGSGPKTALGNGVDLSKDFHTYAVEWEKDEMRWYVDNVQYHKMSLVRSFYSGRGTNPYTANRQPFDQRFHILVNLAIGGGFFPSGQYGTLSPADAANWADPTYQIDYIRVYQWSTTPPPVTSSPVAPTTRATTKATVATKASIPAEPTEEEKPTEETNDPAIPINNVGAQEAANDNNGKIMGMQKSVVGGIAAIIGVFLIVIVVVVVVFVRRRRSAKQDVMSTTELAVPGMTPVISPKIQLFVPTIGMKCMAKYSDGQFYSATIEEVQDGQCLVNYGPQYGDEKVWVNRSDLKA
jgi:beta-glucanase (GH16 family)